MCCLSYTVNTMPADALATLGARASAGMALTKQARIFQVVLLILALGIGPNLSSFLYARL